MRADLGFEMEEKLTLRHLTARLREAVEGDVPDHALPTAHGQPGAMPLNGAEPSPEDRLAWGP